MQCKVKGLVACFAFFHVGVFGQNSVGIGTANPNTNAMLDVQSGNDKNALLAEVAGNGSAVFAIARGSGPAINVSKPANSSGQGIYVDHLGTSGPVAQFRRSNANASGPALIGYNNSNQTSSPGIYANHEGTGDAALVARINNAANPFAASYAETNGSGPALFAYQIGVGRGAQIQISNTANSNISLRSLTNGTGKAGLFTISNTSSADTALMAETNGGGGAAVAGIHRGSWGHAGIFSIASASNNAAVLKVETAGNGAGIDINSQGTASGIIINKPSSSSGQGIYIDHQGTSGPVAQFRRTNASANGAAIIGYTNSNQAQSSAIYGNNEGTGDAAIVARINNSGNPYSALFGETNGSGPAVFASQIGTGRGGQFQIGNPSNTQHALRTYTDGLGRAAYFTVNNASNNESAVLAEINSSTGVAVSANNQANGYALSLVGGGTKLSTANLTSGTNITTRASAYLISGGGPYMFGFTLSDGELLYFYNLTNADVTINARPIPANAGKTFVVLGGILREM